jgi:hypothetical protein
LAEVGNHVMSKTSLIGGIVNRGTAVEEVQQLKGDTEATGHLRVLVTLSPGKRPHFHCGEEKKIAIPVGSRSPAVQPVAKFCID